MVSVCDLPYSEMDSFLGKYGNYAIGLSLDWGKRNGLNPVWYCLGKSNVLTQMAKRFEKAKTLEERKTIFDILSYTLKEFCLRKIIVTTVSMTSANIENAQQ